MTDSKKTTVVLGVTGSIAAYKAADICSGLSKKNCSVNVIMTDSAQQLISAQTFLTLSNNPVITSLWDTADWMPEHIALADRARLLLIAPATANIIGKIANGIADDALSTYALSHNNGPVVIAPAMNPRMWNNRIVQKNIALLREYGFIIIEPAEGVVACGDQGKGKLPPVSVIIDTAVNLISTF